MCVLYSAGYSSVGSLLALGSATFLDSGVHPRGIDPRITSSMVRADSSSSEAYEPEARFAILVMILKENCGG